MSGEKQASRKGSNPKPHDAVFKWAVATFVPEFFDLFFSVTVTDYHFIDKEFIKRYDFLEESLEGDLLIMMRAVVDGQEHIILVLIEFKSKRVDVRKKMREYICYAALLYDYPIWPVVLYSDDARWRKPVPGEIPFGFSRSRGIIELECDIIKLKAHKSADLIRKHSLLARLFALKADDRGIDREEMITEIYQLVDELGDQISDDEKALVERFVTQYSKVAPAKLETIKKGEAMARIGNTITEHYWLRGLEEGQFRAQAREQELLKEERAKAERRGKIEVFDQLLQSGTITAETHRQYVSVLNKELAALEQKQATQS